MYVINKSDKRKYCKKDNVAHDENIYFISILPILLKKFARAQIREQENKKKRVELLRRVYQHFIHKFGIFFMPL